MFLKGLHLASGQVRMLLSRGPLQCGQAGVASPAKAEDQGGVGENGFLSHLVSETFPDGVIQIPKKQRVPPIADPYGFGDVLGHPVQSEQSFFASILGQVGQVPPEQGWVAGDPSYLPIEFRVARQVLQDQDALLVAGTVEFLGLETGDAQQPHVGRFGALYQSLDILAGITPPPERPAQLRPRPVDHGQGAFHGIAGEADLPLLATVSGDHHQGGKDR